jgi:hypothetical protein
MHEVFVKLKKYIRGDQALPVEPAAKGCTVFCGTG